MAIDSAAVAGQIRSFLGRSIPNQELKDSDDIFALGFVNSLFALQLVLFVEQSFGLVVEDEDLTLDNFRSVQAMTGLVMGKLG